MMTKSDTYAPEPFVITIGREFGSGGRQLGRLLAQRLGIDFYDKELLLQAAQNSGISPEFFARNDERMPSFSAPSFMPYGMGINSMQWYSNSTSISDDSLYRTQSDFITQLAKQSSCVIVGRTADYILRDNPRTVNVFIHADMDDCVKRIVERNDCMTADKARKMAERTNKLRANFYNFYTDKRWGHASAYDLCFNSSRLSLDSIAEVIIEYLRHRLGDMTIGR